MKKNKVFREMLQDGSVIRIVGAHDGLSAQLGARAGFDGIWASGLEISTSYGVPDANILTMSQYLERACEMNDAVDIPVMADCDTGYGNSNNVIHMVRKYEAAGISAVCIEDKKFPKVNSFIPGKQDLISVSEFVGKIMAAKSVQIDPDFMVVARVEALIAGHGMAEAVRRAEAYRNAGADAILIHSKSPTPDEIFEFSRIWDRRLPLVVVPTTYYKTTASEFQKAGMNIVIYANQGIRASVAAVESVLAEICRNGSTATVEDKISPMKHIFELQGMPEMKASEKEFLLSEREKVSAIIIAAGDHLEEDTMKDISSEIPISMLDVNGKPLLQRQLETFHKSFIGDVHVVGGYKKELINVDGINLIENNDFASTGILHSLMCAADRMDSKVVVTYGDIFFENVVLELLIKNPNEITLLVDSAFRGKTNAKPKALDFVITDSEPVSTKRKLVENETQKLARIGCMIDPDKAHYEFPGIMVLSKNGAKVFKEVYADCLEKYSGKPFQEAAVFEKAGLADLLQEIHDRGYPVSCKEINSGWLEIHSIEDYKLACSLIK